jgi:nicotinamidase-related amidase
MKDRQTNKNTGPGKGSKPRSRREFIAMSSAAGLGGMLVPGSLASGAGRNRVYDFRPEPGEKVLHIHPRYHRWFVDPGVEWLEANTTYASLDWKIPVSRVAIVLVDVWQRHYLKDTEERAEGIIRSALVPMLRVCRETGLNIIHAPSPEVAVLHRNWVRLQSLDEIQGQYDSWPPEDFVQRRGAYSQYAMPFEPREEERNRLPALTFHPLVVPAGDEPVIATGEELHRYCRKKGIMFLLFAGFNTNACILERDYGTLRMGYRGYGIVLIRDCTTGMESAATHADLGQTNNAILFLEMFDHFTVSSGDIVSGIS